MANPVKFNGIEYSSLKSLFDSKAEKEITYSMFTSRIRNEWSLERALTEKPHKYTRRTYHSDKKKFPTLKKISEAAGISYQAAVKRMHRGWTDDEILNGKAKKHKKNKKDKKERGHQITIMGITYENIRKAHDSLQPSASLNTVKARLRYGWSTEEALEVIKKTDGRKENKKSIKITLNGIIFNAKEISEKFNLPYSTVVDRIKRGATAEQAVGLAPIYRNDLIPQTEAYKNRKPIVKKTYTVDGVKYKSINELANEFKLSPRLVYNRMRDNGWSAKKAVTEPIYESVTVNGKKFRSAMSAWEEIGQTSFSTYTARKSNGHTLEACLGLEPLPSLERYELHGKTYSTITEIATSHNLTVGQLSSRLQKMSLEEAIDYSPSNGRYSEAIFKENPDLAKSIGRLYFIKIKFETGTLHKIGITQKEISQRFLGFDYQIISEYRGELSLLYKIEQKILSNFRNYHYRADEEFEGKTETFLLMDEEEMEILSFIASHMSSQKPSNAHI